ncbi:hypothetical protein CAOG_00951 [Capsaspora owczarzaki ATCC 30864]|uniref:Peroxisomal membrane protein PEX14 n=1 Tax=Capsaspora owczarzaki (strain ATCC 30864) TaxID=595528 RepID=A0A0D2WI56_CAPO3|nr:hypothetical protein CAOG_00951 [Capsaspora owczarzaki ATCC 30864]KJE89490.1 hypothetical protein CAOG_000951 [Capsaspora owczarzaki ATCC 30864]|eukprot:XP_004365822.1 hypothetical protein CAOG_00951 [Capsaspora owczarzaki ATCC 30864]
MASESTSAGLALEQPQPADSITTTTTTTPTTTSSSSSSSSSAGAGAGAGTTSLREDLLDTATKFLRNPKVQQAPKAKRVAFLEQKGLTAAEIDEAFRRVGPDAPPSQPAAVGSSIQPAQQQQHAQQAIATIHGHLQQQQLPPMGYAPQPQQYPAQQYAGQYGPPQQYYNQQQQPFMMMPPPPPPPHEVALAPLGWKDYAVASAALGAAGYGVWRLTRQFITPHLPEWLVRPDSAADGATTATTTETNEDNSANSNNSNNSNFRQHLDSSLNELKQSVAATVSSVRELADAHKMQADQNEVVMQSLSSDVALLKSMIASPTFGASSAASQDAALAELRSELASLKGLLLNRKQFPSTPSGSSTGFAAAGAASPTPGTPSSSSASLPAWQRSYMVKRPTPPVDSPKNDGTVETTRDEIASASAPTTTTPATVENGTVLETSANDLPAREDSPTPVEQQPQ